MPNGFVGSSPTSPTTNQKYSKLVTGYKILKNRCAIWAEVKGPPRVEILYKNRMLFAVNIGGVSQG